MTFKNSIYFVLLFLSITGWGQNDSDSFYQEAKKETSNSNFRKSANLCIQGLKLSPEDYDLMEVLGKSYLELNKLDSARYLLKKVVDHKRMNASALKYLVTVEYISKRYSSAICYVNEILEVAPYDKDFWLKKINIYNEMGNREEAIRALKRLKLIFPKDEKVKETYNYLMLNKGRDFIKENSIENAKEIYTNILVDDPQNKQVYIELIRSELLAGNKQNALNNAERGLLLYPKDKDLINKKIGVLEALGRYDEAIIYAKSNNQNKELSKTLKYLVSQAANFYKYSDPYELKKKEYEVSKSKKLLVKIINEAIGKGRINDIEYYIRKGLKANKNDKEVLLLQLTYFKRYKDDFAYEKALDTLYKLYPYDSDVQEHYAKLSYSRGKSYLLQKDYQNASKEFTFLTTQEDYKKLALENLFVIAQAQNDFGVGLENIDKLIADNKDDDEQYFAKKSALYEKMGAYKKALAISKDLIEKHPENERYKKLFISESENYVSFLMKNEQYEKALDVIIETLFIKPTKFLNNQAINAAVAMEDYERAMTFAEMAKELYEDNKVFRLKLADVQLKSKDYNNALSTLNKLYKEYPYSPKVKGSLVEAAFKKGKYLENRKEIDSALVYYKYSAMLGEKDNPAIHSVANLLIANNRPDETLAFIDGLPLVDNELDYKKGLAFEQLKQYDSAYVYQKKFNPSIKEYKDWKSNVNCLKYKSLKNQIEFSHTENLSDSLDFKSAITSLTYSRFKGKNIYSGQLNYVTRKNAVALQLNLGWAHVFTNTLYGKVNYAVSNTVFPKHKLAVSAFKSLPKDYEVQLGARYAILDEINLATGILGLSKTVNDFWLNSKLFVFYDSNGDLYNNIVLQGKCFFKNTDHVSLILSTGTAPYEERLDFQNNTFLNFVSAMVGVGYSKQLSPKSALAANLNWYNYQVEDKLFSQQTSITVSFKTRF